MKKLTILAALYLAPVAYAQTPYVERFGQRKDTPPAFRQSGVFWPDKRIPITISDYAGQPTTTYYQPYDFPIPAGPRNIPRVWYPVQIYYWTDGRPWVYSWAYAGYTLREYRLQYDENAK